MRACASWCVCIDTVSRYHDACCVSVRVLMRARRALRHCVRSQPNQFMTCADELRVRFWDCGGGSVQLAAEAHHGARLHRALYYPSPSHCGFVAQDGSADLTLWALQPLPSHAPDADAGAHAPGANTTTTSAGAPRCLHVAAS
jgi:hypothetical protein